MNIRAYKEYRFAGGILDATRSGKSYIFRIPNIHDQFYHNMEKHIIKQKVEELSWETIGDISIQDPDKTFFEEKTFMLSIQMLVTDRNDETEAYWLTMKNVKLKETAISTKDYKNSCWNLKDYDLEIPYQTDIEIIKIED